MYFTHAVIPICFRNHEGNHHSSQGVKLWWDQILVIMWDHNPGRNPTSCVYMGEAEKKPRVKKSTTTMAFLFSRQQNETDTQLMCNGCDKFASVLMMYCTLGLSLMLETLNISCCHLASTLSVCGFSAAVE